MTKNVFIPAILLLALFVTGCSGTPKYKRAPVTPQAMACTGNIPAQITLYSPLEAKLVYEGKAHTLNRMESASGVKYGNANITYWNKGIESTITRKDGFTTSCACTPRSGL